MYEYIKNESKNFEIFRANVIAYMLNCDAEGKVIRNLDMYQFSTRTTSLQCKNQQMNAVITKLIDRNLVKRTIRGKYAVVRRNALEIELENALVDAGMEKIEGAPDQLLELLNPENPNKNNFRINVLRHMINSHIQQMPIRTSDLNKFSSYCQPKGTYHGILFIFNKLLKAGAIKPGARQGKYHVTDLNVIKKMLCEKEQAMSVPLSYPGMARIVKPRNPLPASRSRHAEMQQIRENKPSPWHKPTPAWVGALDAVFGNLGR